MTPVGERQDVVAARRHGLLVVEDAQAQNARQFDMLGLAVEEVAVLIGLGRLTPFAVAIVIAAPRAVFAVKRMSQPRPAVPPGGYVGWPLWYHRACLEHNRMLGWAYIGGLAAGDLWHPEL